MGKGDSLWLFKFIFTMLIDIIVCIVLLAVESFLKQDLPFDPTGELDSLRSFIEDNVDICKWVGITVVVIQVFCHFTTFVDNDLKIYEFCGAYFLIFLH